MIYEWQYLLKGIHWQHTSVLFYLLKKILSSIFNDALGTMYSSVESLNFCITSDLVEMY